MHGQIKQVPPGIYDEQGRSINKDNIYISETSPEAVSHAYSNQFHLDFSLFLQSRSQEVVVGGKMVIILLGRAGPPHVDRGNSFFWKLLSQSLANLVSRVHTKLFSINLLLKAKNKVHCNKNICMYT